MKGTFSLSFTVIVATIAVAVMGALIVEMMPSDEEYTSYLNLPQDSWMELSSLESSVFVPPPVIWFGGELKKGDTSVDFSNVVFEQNPYQLVFLGDKSIEQTKKASRTVDLFENTDAFYTIQIETDLMPTAAMYPLVTDAFGTCPATAYSGTATTDDGKTADFCYFDADEEFGAMTLRFSFDTESLDEYFIEKNDASLMTGEEKTLYQTESLKVQEEIEKRIKISIGVTSVHGTDDTDKNCYRDSDDGVSLSILGTSECKKVEVLGGIAESISQYVCEFELPKIEHCCPNSLIIQTKIHANLFRETESETKEIEGTIDIMPVVPTMVYYIDYLSNRDLIFEQFNEITGQISYSSSGSGSTIKPVEDIYIYPCRAISLNSNELSRLSIQNLARETIDWSACIDGTGDADSQGYIQIDEGWMCKKTEEGTYYLYNPHAYCRLDGKTLPENPTPIYLKSHIASEDVVQERWFLIPDKTTPQYAWSLAKKGIDNLVSAPFSDSEEGGGSTDTTDAIPFEQQTWSLVSCANCKGVLCEYEIGRGYYVGDESPSSENYACNHDNLKPTICAESSGDSCTMTLENTDGTEVSCSCS